MDKRMAHLIALSIATQAVSEDGPKRLERDYHLLGDERAKVEAALQAICTRLDERATAIYDRL